MQVKDVELRTGLGAQEVGQFGFAARAAGQDVSIFERAMKGLTVAVEEDSKQAEKARATLKSMGVDVASLRNGTASTEEVLLQISRGLEAMPTVWERNEAALTLFKRAGIEIVPVMLELNENIQRARELGLGPSESDVDRFTGYKKQVEETSALWDQLIRKIKEPIAVPVLFVLRWAVNEPEPGSTGWGLSQAMGARGTAAYGQDYETAQMREYLYNFVTGHVALGAPTAAQMQAPYAQVAERKATDAAITSYLNRPKGLDTQLKDAEDALKKLPTPEVGVSSLKDLQDYKAAEDKVESLKKQIKAAKDATKEWDDTLKKFEETLKKQYDLQEKATTKMMEGATTLSRSGQYKPASAVPGMNDLWSEELWNFDLGNFNRNMPSYLKLLYPTGKSQDQQGAELVQEQKQWEQDRIKDDQIHLGVLEKQENLELSMVKIHTRGDEESAIMRTLQTRLDYAQRIYDVEKEIVGTAEAGQQQSEREYEARSQANIEMAQLQAKEFDTIARTSSNLYETLFTHPSRFGAQLSSTVRQAALKPLTEGLGSMTAGILYPALHGGGKLADVNLVNGAVPVHITNMPGGGASTSIYSISGGGAGTPIYSIGGTSGGGATSGGWSGGGGAPTNADLANLPMVHGGLNPYVLAGLGGGGTGGGGGAGAGGGGLFGQILNGGFAKGSTTAGFHPGQILANLKNTNWGGFTRNDQGSINGVNGVAGAALFTGGTMLATSGLMGNNRGTWTGIGEGAAGGAMIGLQMGGPLGAAIGGAVGAGIGIGEKIAGVESPENEAKRLVKQIYNISIDNSMAQKIVAIAQQKYANHVSIAVRDPDIRKMLQLYAEGTGQKFPLSATTPVGGSLVEQGGNLYQQASYVNGQPYTFQSSLPVLGGFSTGTYPNAGMPSSMASGGGVNLALNINGQPITPDFVADQSLAAQGASYGRTQQAANMQVPGLMVA